MPKKKKRRWPPKAYLRKLNQVAWPDLLRICGHTPIQKGRGWRMLCFLHKEKTPSLGMGYRPGEWHCLGCGIGGDVFRFVQMFYRWDVCRTIQFFRRHFNISPE